MPLPCLIGPAYRAAGSTGERVSSQHILSALRQAQILFYVSASVLFTYIYMYVLLFVNIIFIIAAAAAAAAASLQSCPTLCDPIEGSPPGSCIPGILQARTLEQVAISFSNA